MTGRAGWTWLGALLLPFLSGATSGAVACQDLVAEGAWVREPLPGRSSTAGYVSLLNAGEHELSVVDVESPDFGSATLHETRVENGQARMRHLHAIELAPGSRFDASPGGAHLMLGEATRALAKPDAVTLRFRCKGGGSLDVSAPVLRRAPD